MDTEIKVGDFIKTPSMMEYFKVTAITEHNYVLQFPEGHEELYGKSSDWEVRPNYTTHEEFANKVIYHLANTLTNKGNGRYILELDLKNGHYMRFDVTYNRDKTYSDIEIVDQSVTKITFMYGESFLSVEVTE